MNASVNVASSVALKASPNVSGERRKTGRHKSLLGAQLILNAQGSSLDCWIKNISEAGALVLLPGPTVLPKSALLTISKTQKKYHADIIWQTEREAGLYFSTINEDHPLARPQRVAQLEAEIEKLKTRLRNMERRAVAHGVQHIFED